jgi:serine/threonine protein kinase
MTYAKKIEKCLCSFYFQYCFNFYLFIDFVIQKIGTGEEASVYKVRDPDTNRIYAIKRYINNSKKELNNEVEQLRNYKFTHENINKYENIFVGEETLNFVMEYCENGNLEKYVENLVISEEVFNFFFFFNVIYIFILIRIIYSKYFSKLFQV